MVQRTLLPGRVISEYMRRQDPIVAVGRSCILTAGSQWRLQPPWSWAKGTGGAYQTSLHLQVGIIHLGFSDFYSKVFWNDRWIVVIEAAAGTEFNPQVLGRQSPGRDGSSLALAEYPTLHNNFPVVSPLDIR